MAVPLSRALASFPIPGDTRERDYQLDKLNEVSARWPVMEMEATRALLESDDAVNAVLEYCDGSVELAHRGIMNLYKVVEVYEERVEGDVLESDPDGLRILPGDAVFDVPAEPESLWGKGQESLWARGEGLMLYAATGLGKTTMAQRVGLALTGIGPAEVLGYPVEPLRDGERLLYVAADRPRQAMRSLRRMVTEQDRETLHEKWRWEPFRQLDAMDPDAFLRICEREKARCLMLDSAKDLAGGPLKDEEPANRLVNAWQRCIANGIDVMLLHHPRKGQSADTPPTNVDEVYGSSNLTNSVGSVVVLYGGAGEGMVRFRQLKMPAEQISDMDVFIHYESGRLEKRDYRDLNSFLQHGGWVSVRQVASFMHAKSTDRVEEGEKKKTQRELDSLVEKDLVEFRKVGQAYEYRWKMSGVTLVEDL